MHLSSMASTTIAITAKGSVAVCAERTLDTRPELTSSLAGLLASSTSSLRMGTRVAGAGGGLTNGGGLLGGLLDAVAVAQAAAGLLRLRLGHGADHLQAHEGGRPHGAVVLAPDAVAHPRVNAPELEPRRDCDRRQDLQPWSGVSGTPATVTVPQVSTAPKGRVETCLRSYVAGLGPLYLADSKRLC